MAETHTETRDCKVDSRVESRELLYAAQKDHRAYPCSTGRAHREEFKDERRERCSLRDSDMTFHAHNFHCRHVTVNNVPLLFNARHTYFVYLSLFFFTLCSSHRTSGYTKRERYREMDFINMEIFSWNLDVTYEHVWNIGTKDVG